MKATLNYLFIFIILSINFVSAEKNPSADTKIIWMEATELRVEGRGWGTELEEAGQPYRRLPLRAEGKVSDMNWKLSAHTAGISVRFITNAPEFWVEWDGGGAMYHMPRSGVSGLDIYVRTEDGSWKFHAIGRPDTKLTTRTIEAASEKWMRYTNRKSEDDNWAKTPTSDNGDKDGWNEYWMFLPLYQKVTSLRLGHAPGFEIKGAERPHSGTKKPVLFYGTSITQGGCASRAGMAHASILSRWLDMEVINLGFSGSGQMEIEMADLQGELDVELYVLECLPNMTLEMVRERVVPYVKRLREHQPDTPILMIEHCLMLSESKNNKAYRAAYETLIADGTNDLHYLPNGGMLDGRENGTVDGIHPTDLGFLRIATYYEPVLRELLEIKTATRATK